MKTVTTQYCTYRFCIIATVLYILTIFNTIIYSKSVQTFYLLYNTFDCIVTYYDCTSLYIKVCDRHCADRMEIYDIVLKWIDGESTNSCLCNLRYGCQLQHSEKLLYLWSFTSYQTAVVLETMINTT